MRTRKNGRAIHMVTYSLKNVPPASITTNRLQFDLLERLEQKFPSSMKIFFKEVCDKATFLKKGFEEKKEIFLTFLKKYGNIIITFHEMGADIQVPPKKDGKVLVGYIGKSPIDTFGNFFGTLESVLPQLEVELL